MLSNVYHVECPTHEPIKFEGRGSCMKSHRMRYLSIALRKRIGEDVTGIRARTCAAGLSRVIRYREDLYRLSNRLDLTPGPQNVPATQGLSQDEATARSRLLPAGNKQETRRCLSQNFFVVLDRSVYLPKNETRRARFYAIVVCYPAFKNNET